VAAALVVEASVVVPSVACARIYALLQCGEDSEYERKAYDGYFEVFHAQLVENGESSLLASGNFQSGAA
jgi:hypothetical protein